MKLSNFWENWAEFAELCLSSGTNDTRYRIKIQKTFFDEKGIFEGNWKKLLDDVIWIFCNDKRLARKFDYTESQRLYFQTIFNNKYSKDYLPTIKRLNEMLFDNFYGGVQWNSETKAYDVLCTINLTDKKSPNADITYTATIKGNTQNLDKFEVTVMNKNKIIGSLLIVYNNKIYSHTINLDTGRKVQISKYSEIIHFINAKFFQVYLMNMNFFQFKYLTKSFINYNYLFVPEMRITGKLYSQDLSTIIRSLKDLEEYLEYADNQVDNKLNVINMVDVNRFEIKRIEDEAVSKARTEDENYWGKLRSGNGSRKGPINHRINNEKN